MSLLAAGLISAPGKLMNTPFSLVLGMTYTYLPFMILPLYGNLAKLDLRLLEAAADLGATPWVAFWKITVPLSKAGIIAGSMLVFIPCVGEFVIPELLGGPETLMIGRVLWDEFFSNNDWPMASSVAVTMIVIAGVGDGRHLFADFDQLHACAEAVAQLAALRELALDEHGKIFDVTGQRDRALNEYQRALQTNDNTQGAIDEANRYIQKPYKAPAQTS